MVLYHFFPAFSLNLFDYREDERLRTQVLAEASTVEFQVAQVEKNAFNPQKITTNYTLNCNLMIVMFSC